MLSDWQNFSQTGGHAPYIERFAARMPDGRFLDLPLRENGDAALADFAADQASFLVLDAIAEWLARALRPHRPELVAGFAARSGVLAAEVARRLSHPGWIALADRPRPWFTDQLSVAASPPAPPAPPPAPPGPPKRELPFLAPLNPPAPRPAPSGRWWLDPVLGPRLAGRRVALVHDLLEPETALPQVAQLLGRAGAASVVVGVAMTQGDGWERGLPSGLPVLSVFATPAFRLAVGGWVPQEDSAAWRVCPLFRHGMLPGAASAPPVTRMPGAEAPPTEAPTPPG